MRGGGTRRGDKGRGSRSGRLRGVIRGQSKERRGEERRGEGAESKEETGSGAIGEERVMERGERRGGRL